MADLSTEVRSDRANVAFRPALPDDHARILDLYHATPFGQRLSLTLATDPAHPAPLTDPARCHTVVASRPRSPRAILGLAGRDVHSVFFDGQPALVGYLARLRRMPGEEITRRRLCEGFRLLEAHRRPDELSFDYTSVLADNTPARRLLERGLPGLPSYDPVGRVATLTFASSRAARFPTRGVRSLHAGDHAPLLALLERTLRQRNLAPCCPPALLSDPDLSWLVASRDNRLVGAAALWDQSAFKTLTITDYAPWLRRLRGPLNLARALRGAPALPPAGRQLPLAFVSFLATDPEDPALLRALLGAAARRAIAQGLACLNLGLPAAHPSLRSLRRNLRADCTSSIIYLVHPPHQSVVPLSSASPVHPEIALL